MLKKINIRSNFKCFSNGNLKKKVENLNLKASKNFFESIYKSR